MDFAADQYDALPVSVERRTFLDHRLAKTRRPALGSRFDKAVSDDHRRLRHDRARPRSHHGAFCGVAAGLSGWGTQAAGELLAENRLMETLARDAPPDWASKNIQAIINTKVVAGNSGPPMVVAKYFW